MSLEVQDWEKNTLAISGQTLVHGLRWMCPKCGWENLVTFEELHSKVLSICEWCGHVGARKGENAPLVHQMQEGSK